MTYNNDDDNCIHQLYIQCYKSQNIINNKQNHKCKAQSPIQMNYRELHKMDNKFLAQLWKDDKNNYEYKGCQILEAYD